ncbi:MAG: c-type cytochrome [Nevskia sp.]|nr:c-type cytochrome [Nevskia sp.]
MRTSHRPAPQARALAGVAVLATALSACSGTAGPVPPPRAAACGVCHALHGEAMAGIYPILAGQHSAYLQAQLRAFKDGSRRNATMSPLAAGLGPNEIVALSDYFESLGKTPGALRPPQ